MKPIYLVKSLLRVFKEYPEIYEFISMKGDDNQEWDKVLVGKNEATSSFLATFIDYKSFNPSKEFIEKYEKVIYWHELLKERPSDNWLRTYYLDYLIRNNRLHEYDQLTSKIISGNEDAVNWDKLARNDTISILEPWNMKFVKKFWHYLRRPKASTKKPIEGLGKGLKSKRRSYYNIFVNRNIPWDKETILELNIPVEYYYKLMITNPFIPWDDGDLEFFKTFGNKTFLGSDIWNNLSENQRIDWSQELLLKYQDLWRWDLLSENESIKFDENLFETFINNWYWNYISARATFPWSIDTLNKYKNSLNWDLLSSNENLPWSENFIEEFLDRWNWSKISKNQGIIITDTILLKFEPHWDWNMVCENNSVKWSHGLIKQYHNVLNFTKLTENPNIKFTEKLILEFRDKWNWEILSRKKSLPWSIEFLEKVERNVYWSYISQNESLPWNLFLLEKYASRWDWELLYVNDYHKIPINYRFIEKFIYNIMNTDIDREDGVKYKLSPSVIAVFEKFKEKDFLPAPNFISKDDMEGAYGLEEKAKQFLSIHKPLIENEWVEVSLIEIILDVPVKRSYSGDRNYNYYKVKFSCANKESLVKANEYYNAGDYLNCINALNSFTTELEQDELRNCFIGQRFLIKSTLTDKISGRNHIYPLHYYKSKFASILD